MEECVISAKICSGASHFIFLTFDLFSFRYPDAVRTREKLSGAYPFHFACQSGIQMEIIEVLYQAYPEAATELDRDGNTVLHLVCQRRPSVELVEFLLEKFPESPEISNNAKYLPLHIAIDNRCAWPILDIVLQRHPASIHTVNGKGRLPLHDAFRVRTRMTTLVRLAQLYPAGLDMTDNFDKHPDEYATELFSEQFYKAQRNYNCRHAWCPCLIRAPKK